MGYVHVKGDDCEKQAHFESIAGMENRYYSKDENKQLYFDAVYKKMYDSGIAHEKVIYDYVEPNGIIKLYETHGKELFVVMVYANLSKLVDNIDTSKTPNPKYVFVQFTDKYIATDDKGIDVVQKSQFTPLKI